MEGTVHWPWSRCLRRRVARRLRHHAQFGGGSAGGPAGICAPARASARRHRHRPRWQLSGDRRATRCTPSHSAMGWIFATCATGMASQRRTRSGRARPAWRRRPRQRRHAAPTWRPSRRHARHRLRRRSPAGRAGQPAHASRAATAASRAAPAHDRRRSSPHAVGGRAPYRQPCAHAAVPAQPWRRPPVECRRRRRCRASGPPVSSGGISWRWPADGQLIKGFSCGDAIPGYRDRRQVRRSRACGGRWRGGLQRQWPGGLRRAGDHQAQRQLPLRLRSQPQAPGEGRSAGDGRPGDRRDGFHRRHRATSCSSRSAATAIRSIRWSTCRRADAAGSALRQCRVGRMKPATTRRPSPASRS